MKQQGPGGKICQISIDLLVVFGYENWRSESSIRELAFVMTSWSPLEWILEPLSPVVVPTMIAIFGL